MGTPGFEQLTTAEKLNDAGYRALVYRAYPNEPGCACPPIASDKAKTNKRQQQRQSCCPSGCAGRCCNRLRAGGQDAAAAGVLLPANDPLPLLLLSRRGRLQFMPTHCAAATTTTAKNDELQQQQQLSKSSRRKRRMRGGGGSGGDLAVASLFSGDADFAWYNSRFAVPSARLEGGGGAQQQQAYPASGCGKAAAGRQRHNGYQNSFDNSYLRTDAISPEYLALNKCRLRHVEDNKAGDPKLECSCKGQDHLDSMLKKKGHAVCRKKPCMGTDCLIQAFKDAQEFVESLGKVPGLAGLGISESPYFGKPHEQPREVKKADPKANKQLELPMNSLCSTQNIENLKKSNYNAMSSPFATSVAKKPGVVQEGITSFPDPATHASLKSKKKDEKLEKPKEAEAPPPQIVEDTPCGEPKCKSRPKKVAMETSDSQANNVESSQKLSHKADRTHALKGRSQSVPGDKKAKKSPRFDHSYGSAYPTSVYGHKTCSLLRPRVPAHMGWMWNKFDPIAKLKPRTGWRPGAISVTLRELLKEARDGFFKEAKRPMSLPRLGGKKGGKAQKTMSYAGLKKGANPCEEAEVEEEIEFPPTLHVHRKDGTYYITMYPIRQDPETGVPRLDEPTNPLQFKIVKSKDSLASSSTASDMKIDFSPPAAVNRLKKKPNVVHVETQVKQQEILDSFKKPSNAKKSKGKDKSQKDKKK